ncbi:gliding motility-associated C-terminal domain-containing protein [Gelidibacter maritimus]|uniref:Gliding motility-associated C-terminal domain-containing protein n=1 Tax=Gelidibacter maritimus TaxID=2761487 RepID=A0A7W2M446_9FLAO|nr:gliding motility-associated C-terminal domain-containing protein [Gelidibacter maritimus]MBA6152328.1 gliding motility-associated C-terminal domain-containing protein [Gelidibacter maritimus]
MRKITKANLYTQLLVAFICFIGVSLHSFGQCPTVTNPTQSFCDIEAPKISDLVATDNGGGIRWYETSTSTTPLSNTVGLVNGNTYYADDSSGTCGSRQPVNIVIYGVPFGLGFQGVCVDDPSEATIADLYAIGNDLQWYSQATGGTPLDPSTNLVDSTVYYVNQSNPDTGCRTSRLSVFVNVGLVPVPTGEAHQIFCGDIQPTVADLVASGNNNWYSTLSSGSPLDPSTPLVDGESYFATTRDLPCESLERFEVTVEIAEPNDAGSNGEMEICESGLTSTGSINLFDALLGTPDTNGVWSGPLPTTNGTTGTVDVTSMSSAASPYVFSYSVSSEDCPTSVATISIFVIEGPNPGMDGSLILCSSDAPQDLFDSLQGTPEPGGFWTPALASGTGVFDPAQDTAGTYTYTVQGVPPCGDVTATVEVSVNPEVDPGTNGDLTLCFDSPPTNLFDSLGGSPQSGGTWTPALASGTGIFDPSQDADGVYTYTVTGISPCGPATATVTVTTIPPPDPGTNGNLILCSNDATVDLFDSLGGTPETGGTWSPALASGTGVFDPSQDTAGVYTYTLQGPAPCGTVSSTVTVTINPEAAPGIDGTLALCIDSAPEDLFDSLGGTPETGGTWSPALASGTGVFDPTQDTAGVYTYKVSGVAPCADATATVTVTVNPLPNPGTDATLILCSHDAPQDLFESLGGSPDAGGVWSPALASGTGVFDPSQDTAGIYTYTVQGAAPCGAASAIVEVTVNPGVEPGTNGSLTLCMNSAPENLFDSLGGNPQAGGTWSPALASGTGIFDPTKDAEGVYTYTIVGISPCGDATATVTVSISELSDAGTDGSLVLCSNDTSQDLFDSLGGTPKTGGVWSPALASGTGVFDPTQDTAGIYTYTVQGVAPCGEASATVEVSINPEADPGTNGSLALCVESAPEDLFNSLGGNPESGGTWSPALASGTGIFDPSQDVAGTYTYTVAGMTPCSDATATVTVTIAQVPEAGSNGRLAICTNDAPQDLIDSLGGTPDAGGTWTPALSSGTGVFDPTQDAPGSYTYSVTTICGTVSATVIVALIPQPDISGLSLTADTICLDEALDITLSDASQLNDGNYSLNYALSGANVTEQTINVTIANGSTIINLPASELTTAGTTTFTILNLLDPVTNCGTASGTLPTVDFNVEQAPTPQLIEDGASFCDDAAPTIADLTSNLTNAENITWYDALENGNPYPEDTPLVDGNTYYAENSTTNGCTTGIRLAATISIDSCEPLEIIIPDGFSPNGDTINDEFVIINLRGLYPNFKLQIYNRYGNILFKGDNNTPDWDGTSNQGREVGNGELPVGVYFYILELKDTNNKTIQGRVYLSR